MSEPADKSPQDETLELISRLLEMGVVPRNVRIGHGTVEVTIHTVERPRGETSERRPGSYLERALTDRSRTK